jgi:hypothetical protein
MMMIGLDVSAITGIAAKLSSNRAARRERTIVFFMVTSSGHIG